MVDFQDVPAARAAALPFTPGVYRFRDRAGRVLYIGRAPGDFGPYLGGQKARDAVSGLSRVLPLGHAADQRAGTGRELALVRGASPAARADLARGIVAVLNRDQAAVDALRAELTARRDAAATALAFEFAGKLQTELEAVDWVTAAQRVTRAEGEADVYGWADGLLVCFEIRGGRMTGWRQRPCSPAAARRYLGQSPPGWAAFALVNAQLAARLRPCPPGTCAG